VSTFYLLPPRSLLADHLVDCLGAFLPGVEFDCAERCRLFSDLIESIGAGNQLVVYREDLPAGTAVEQALVDGYGAEQGDEVVEVRPGLPSERIGQGRFRSSRWRIGESRAARAA
jgi:hypothetical protein